MAVFEHVFSDSDLPALADALSRWNEAAGSCGYYHPGDLYHWVKELLGERARQNGGVRFWTSQSEIVGFAVCGLFDCAYQVLAHPEWRGGVDERAWLLRAEAITRNLRDGQPGIECPEGVITDVFDCDTIRRSSLDALGYEAYRVWDHVNERSLDEPLPGVMLPSGFTIRAASAVETPALERLNDIIFGHMNAAGPIDANPAGPFTASDQKTRTLVAVSPEGELAGMATLHLDDRNRVGLFEPVGVHPRFRRLGLARAVMTVGLREMAAADMRTARVSHDATNTAASELYRSLGFVKRYNTLGYRRPSTHPGEPSRKPHVAASQ